MVPDLVVALEDQMDGACACGRANALGELIQDMCGAAIDDGVDGVEAQAVHGELFDPIEGVVDDEFACLVTVPRVEIERLSPRSAVLLGDDVGEVEGDVVALWAEVVVDHVEEDHHVACVGGID